MSSGVRPKQPTIRDIAARAGVAPMTVSRAINENGYVSSEARERILRAVKDLDYHPNGLARSLKRRRTHVVGILLPDIGHPFSAELGKHLEETFLARGYTSFISTSQRSVEREQAALNAFFDHRVDGIVVATLETRAGNDALLRLVNRGVPTVIVGRTLSHENVDQVNADHWKGGHEMVQHLVGLGHRRIGFIGASMPMNASVARFQGYVDGLKEHGCPVSPDLIIGPDDLESPAFATQEQGYEGMKRLAALDNPPSAVFARNDAVAMGALRAARDLGLSIPDDIAIAGFDNLPISAYTSPPLTTVNQPTAILGHRAAEFVLDRIEGRVTADRRDLRLDCEVVVRESTVGRPVQVVSRATA
jgi:DNA-binding LacI/PurR family transcriptional regulator